MAILIGSKALKLQGVEFREPHDTDLFVEEGESYFSYQDVQVLPKNIISLVPTTDCGNTTYPVATPEAVLTIKTSHLSWDIKWDKHYRDVLYLKSLGYKVIPELFEALSEHWKKVNGTKEFLSLKQQKSDFFDDHVTYLYDHDYLHNLMSHPKSPIYKNCLKDGEEVLMCKSKFDSMPFSEQVSMFREEIGVIACERWLIPPVNKGKFNLTQAWQLALKKTVTSLTKGWASEFIVLKLEHFYKPNRSDFDYIFKTLCIGDLNMKAVNKSELLEDILLALSGCEEEVNEEELIYALCHSDFYKEQITALSSEGGYEHIEQEGGGEGGTEYCYTVFKWRGDFYKMTYSYYSHHGFDMDYVGFYKVTPKEKTFVVWE